MLFEQYQPQELLTPSINDGGVSKLNSSLTSLDFYLLDDIEAYLSPIDIKKSKYDLINDNNYDNSQHHDELFSEFNLADLQDFDEKSDFLSNTLSIEDLEIEKWISQSSFPSPPMDSNNSPFPTIEDKPSTFTWITSSDMVVPPSPPLSSIGSSPSSTSSSPSSTSSSPAPITKKSKLSIVERKIRKKSQNKTAAEKYRTKKKSERHVLLDQHLQLKTTNKELKLELENLTYRIQHIKQIFNDLLQIKIQTSN